jgi:outer membrane lipoprotein-sorting protein
MRYALSILLLSALLPRALAQDNEAEKLFRDMEKKVRAAETLKLHFDAVITDADGKKWNVKGTLALGEGDKFRAEAEGKLFGEAVRFTVVSDGIDMRSFGDKDGSKKGKAEKSPVGVFFRGRSSARAFSSASSTSTIAPS